MLIVAFVYFVGKEEVFAYLDHYFESNVKVLMRDGSLLSELAAATNDIQRADIYWLYHSNVNSILLSEEKEYIKREFFTKGTVKSSAGEDKGNFKYRYQEGDMPHLMKYDSTLDDLSFVGNSTKEQESVTILEGDTEHMENNLKTTRQKGFDEDFEDMREKKGGQLLVDVDIREEYDGRLYKYDGIDITEAYNSNHRDEMEWQNAQQTKDWIDQHFR
jgi:hypothetical protein